MEPERVDISLPRMISESEAWDTANDFAVEASEVLGSHMVAVVTVGSLPTGGYIPGRSDIDLIVVAKDICPDDLLSEIKRMAERYWKKYGFSKGFGGYAIRERDLCPPFGSLQDVVFEILQLKQQGRVILGDLDLSAIPEPSHEDMKRSLVIFAAELSGAWKRTFPPPIDIDDARVNTILYWLRFFVWDRTGIYILGKRHVISAFLALPGTEAVGESLARVRAYIFREVDQPGPATLLCRDVEAFVLANVEWTHKTRCSDRQT